MNAKAVRYAARHAGARAARFNLWAVVVVLLVTGVLVYKARADAYEGLPSPVMISQETTR